MSTSSNDECPYEVRISPNFGRYLIAARDLSARELIISEEPVIQGPTDDPDNIPMCLGCCLKLTENQYSRCSRCHFPLCGSSCEGKENLHASNECRIFSENHVQFPPPFTKHILNKSIIILRCLLMKTKCPEKWDQLMAMSDNAETRRNRPNCIVADERILENLRTFLPQDGRQGSFQFEEEQVIKISGILDVNAHAFPVKVGGEIVASKCHIYSKTSLIAHSCSPNSSWSAPDPSHKTRLVIRSNLPIAKGDLISVAYDDEPLLFGTLRRLLPMEMSGMFICKCARCLDPTEFGTYLSGLKCLSCSPGYLLSSNPTNSFSDWVCDTCGEIVDEVCISEVIEGCERAVGCPKRDLLTDPDTPGDVQLLKQYVDDVSGGVLHPNHYIIQEVNLRIVRAECYSLQELGVDGLSDFLERCRSLMKVADVLTPGFCEFRAFLAYHYFRGLLLHQEQVPISFLSEEAQNNANIESQPIADDLQTFLGRYQLILQLQTEVLTFLQEKFTSSSRIDYVRETMDFVQEQIKLLENVEPQDCNNKK